MILLVCTWKS